jgi:uncharacterized protein
VSNGQAPISPCVGTCTLDPGSGYCLGCKRTIEEIAQWPRLDAVAKRRVIAALAERRVAGSSIQGPASP